METRPNSPNRAQRGLPLRGSPPRRVILASHLILTGYGHWLPNDPRGSGSEEIRKDGLRELGAILPGRQFPQPPRENVRQYFKSAEPKLEHERIWFNDAMRNAIASGIASAIKRHHYTLWALSICSNHVHLIVQTHKDRAEIFWRNLADAAREALIDSSLIPDNHPVWSHRPYKVFLYLPSEIRGRIDYVLENPRKERLTRQTWDFMKTYGK